MKCLRCGKCCGTKGIMKQSNFIEKIVYRFIIFSKIGFRNPKCPHLRFRSRNAYCAIYEKRPDFCREYYCEKAKKTGLNALHKV